MHGGRELDLDGPAGGINQQRKLAFIRPQATRGGRDRASRPGGGGSRPPRQRRFGQGAAEVREPERRWRRAPRGGGVPRSSGEGASRWLPCSRGGRNDPNDPSYFV
jgi:hypothetical protein